MGKARGPAAAQIRVPAAPLFYIISRMKLIPFILAAMVFCCGCMSYSKATVVTRGQMQEARACAAGQSRKFKEISVDWKQRLLRTDAQNTGLTPQEKKVPPQPVDEADLLWLDKLVRQRFAEAGLYDPETGSGTLRVVVISYNRWTYGQLTHGFLIDTSWLFILPASISTVHYMNFSMQQDDSTVEFTKNSTVKTCFHLLLFPLYPFMPPGRSETGALKSLVDSGVLSVMTERQTARDCYGKRFNPPKTKFNAVPPKTAAPVPPPLQQAQPSAVPVSGPVPGQEAAPVAVEPPFEPASAEPKGEYGVQIMSDQPE